MLSNRQRSDAESLPLEPSNLICVSAVAPAIDNSTCDHGLFITVLACFEHKSFVTTKSVPGSAVDIDRSGGIRSGALDGDVNIAVARETANIEFERDIRRGGQGSQFRRFEITAVLMRARCRLVQTHRPGMLGDAADFPPRHIPVFQIEIAGDHIAVGGTVRRAPNIGFGSRVGRTALGTLFRTGAVPLPPEANV